MNIGYLHGENMGKRYVRKEFKCLSCNRLCKKLVHILTNKIQCPFCYSDNCQEILFAKGINNNNTNYEIDNSSLKTNITLKDEDFGFNSSSNNNIYNELNHLISEFKFEIETT